MQWDYIVIGAGSAGCALTYELAQSGKARVLLLEAGGSLADMAKARVVVAGLVVFVRSLVVLDRAAA